MLNKTSKWLKVLAIVLLVFLIVGCSPNDLQQTFYAPNVMPNANNTGSVGTSTDEWQNGSFQNLYVNGLLQVSYYGQLWSDEAGRSVTVVVAGTFYAYAPATAGLSNGTTLAPFPGLGTITVNAGGKGVYRVSLTASSSVSHPNSTIHWAVFVGNTEHNEIECEAVQNTTDISPTTAIGIVQLNDGDVVSMRVTSNFAGDVITVNHASLTLNRIQTN